MELINSYTYIIKKSKFIAYYYSINNKEDVDTILNNLKKEHKKATHFPYAFKINELVKKSDDKEPSNTAGYPLYNLIEKNNLNHVLIVVVRYFGGTKLGAGNLMRSYNKAGIEVIKSYSDSE